MQSHPASSSIYSHSQKLYAHSRHKSLTSLDLGSLITACAAVFLLVLFVCYLFYRKVKARIRTNPYDFTSVTLKRFSYRKLKAATNGFSNANKLGQGGFGAVYKGVLKNGQEVAVKKMDAESLQGEREFQNEVMIIGNVSSPHIVRLLGFCVEGKRRLLVYEYMANRSLQETLFDEDKPVMLDWRMRFKIVQDVAWSLQFLHHSCAPPIIHGDVKPSNILLDANFSAKIADFGLARLRTEVAGVEFRGEDLEGWKTERDIVLRERIASERKEKRRLHRKAETKGEASGGNTNFENLELPKQSETSVQIEKFMHEIQTIVLEHGWEEERLPCAQTQDSVKNHFTADDQTFAKQSKDLAICVGDDNADAVARHNRDFVSLGASAATQDAIHVKMRTSSRHTSDGIEEQNGSIKYQSFANDNLHEAHVANTRDLRLSLSDKEEAKNLVSPERWWKQGASRSLQDYTEEWQACNVKQSRSSINELQARDIPPQYSQDQGNLLTRSRSNDKNDGLRGTPMGLELWKQCFWDKNYNEFLNVDIRKSKFTGKENDMVSCKDLSSEVGGEKNKEQMRSETTKAHKREMREWWREEYSKELSRKSKNSKMEGRSNKDFWIHSRSRHSKSFDLNGEHGRGALDRWPEHLRSKEWWSGDLVSSNRSRDLANPELSGEAFSRHIKDAKSQEGRRDRSRSRDWWSGDISGRALSSTSSMRGTVCYVAPEFGGGGVLTEKSDVYSFGVLMLVIISGRRPLQVVTSPSEFERANLISWARNLAQTGNLLDLVDAAMEEDYSKEQVLLCIVLAILCLQRLPAVRPAMGEIVKFLSGEIQLPPFPLRFSPSPGCTTLSLEAKRAKPINDSATIKLPSVEQPVIASSVE